MGTAAIATGIIGYGLAGSVFHAPLIAATAGLELSVIVTSDPVRADQARALYPGVRIAATVEQLWQDAPDLVVIATPNTSHGPLATEAISRRVAVVVDKPLAISSREAAELVGLAEFSQVPLTIFQNRRWDGDFLTVAGLVESGELGKIARFESRFERWRPQPSGGWRENVSPAEGGGLLFDLGAHVIDQALQLFGPVRDVYAEVDQTRPTATTDDDVFVALTHQSGTRSHLFMSAVAADLGPRFRVLGTKAGYRVAGLDVQEAALRAGQLPGPGWGAVPHAHWGVISGSESPRPVPTVPGDYPAFYRQLAAALRGNADVPVNPNDAVTTLRIIESARESANTRSVINFS